MKYFLATTGLRETWDQEHPLLLLGPWCSFDGDNKQWLENRGYSMLPSLWKPAEKVKDASDKCLQIYEKILPMLASCLNDVHGVSWSLKYWRILVGVWLKHFIEVFYDRYLSIEQAYRDYPDLCALVLPKEKLKIVSETTREFIAHQVQNDYYNLKLYSHILLHVCPKNTQQIDLDYKESTSFGCVSSSWKRRVKTYFQSLVHSVFGGSTIFSSMYHLSFWQICRLKLKMREAGASFLDFDDSSRRSIVEDELPLLRDSFIMDGASNGFDELLYALIPQALPMCYLERYNGYRRYALRRCRINEVEKVCSAVGWLYNERFKFFAAEAAERGAKLVELQHGGGYGMSSAMPAEDIALEKDTFYTWGWEVSGQDRIKPLPSAHLSSLRDAHRQKADKVLFIGGYSSKYHFRFHTQLLPDDISKYYNDKKIFFENISPEVSAKLLYRPHGSNNEIEINAIRDVSPKTQIVLQSRLINLMKKVKLIIIDHLSTACNEALVLNAPCIWFWDHDVFLMRHESEAYFEALRKAGILHRNPLSASEMINEIADDPSSWWSSVEVQEARVKFCEQFAEAKDDWMDIWANEFRREQAKI